MNSCASRDRIFWKRNSLWSMVSSTQSSQQIEPSLRPCQYVVTTLGQESHCTRVRDGRGGRDNIAATGLAASASAAGSAGAVPATGRDNITATGLAASASAAGAGAVPATRKFRALFADMMRLSPSLWSLELATQRPLSQMMLPLLVPYQAEVSTLWQRLQQSFVRRTVFIFE